MVRPTADLQQQQATRAREMFDLWWCGLSMREVGERYGVTSQAVQQTMSTHIDDYDTKRHDRPHPRPVADKYKQGILDCIRDYRAKYEVSPSRETIAEVVTGKASNAGNISKLIQELIDEGWLYKLPMEANNLVLCKPQPREKYVEE